MRLSALIVVLMLVSTQVVLSVPADDGQSRQAKKAAKNAQKEGKSKATKPKQDRSRQKLKALLASSLPNDATWRAGVEGYLSQIEKRRPEVAARFQQQYDDILNGRAPTAASTAQAADDLYDSDQ